MTRIKARPRKPPYPAPMHRLSVILFSLIAPTLAGTGAVVALVSGFTTAAPLLVGAGLGGVVAVPISVLLARRLN